MSKLFGRRDVPTIREPESEHTSSPVDRQLQAGRAMLGSYVEKAENSVAKSQRYAADAAAAILRQ